MSGKKEPPADAPTDAPPSLAEQKMAKFAEDVKAAQTIFLGIKTKKEEVAYLRVNKLDVITMAEKHGVPVTDVRGRMIFINP